MRTGLAPRVEQHAELVKRRVSALMRDDLAKRKSLGTVTVAQAVRGMDSVPAEPYPGSQVHPQLGLHVGRRSIRYYVDADIPPPAMFLACLFAPSTDGTGPVVDPDLLKQFEADLKSVRPLPRKFASAIRPRFGSKASPMVLLSQAMMHASEYSTVRSGGHPAVEAYARAVEIIAWMPQIVGCIYRIFHSQDPARHDRNWGWPEAFARHLMLKSDDEQGRTAKLRMLALALIIHCDHSTNNSAFVCRTVASAHPTPAGIYPALSSAVHALAGARHGGATEAVMNQIGRLTNNFRSLDLTDGAIEEFQRKILTSPEKLLMGLGHRELLDADIRAVLFGELADQLYGDAPLWKLVKRYIAIGERVTGKFRNVDAVSGTCYWLMGLEEPSFYTLLFFASRSLGLLADLVFSYGSALPIVRPASQDLKWYEDLLKGPDVPPGQTTEQTFSAT